MSGKLADSESWEVEVEEMLTEYRQGQTRVKGTNKRVSRLYTKPKAVDIKSNICHFTPRWQAGGGGGGGPGPEHRLQEVCGDAPELVLAGGGRGRGGAGQLLINHRNIPLFVP